jgi:hypothetical protein
MYGGVFYISNVSLDIKYSYFSSISAIQGAILYISESSTSLPSSYVFDSCTFSSISSYKGTSTVEGGIIYDDSSCGE